MTYTPGDQSRIFVASHSEFSSLRDRDIQRILCNRFILVHGNPSDYDYKWDLESFGRIFDVDRKTSVHGVLGILTFLNEFLLNLVQFQLRFIPITPISDITKEHCEIFTRLPPPYQTTALPSTRSHYHHTDETSTSLPNSVALPLMK